MNLSTPLRQIDTSESSVLIDVLFSLTIASLFSGINQHFGPVKVQLSDLLASATIFIVVLHGFTVPRVSKFLSIILATYLSLFLFSALTVGIANGLKEGIQTVLVLSFLSVAFGYYRTHSTDRLLSLASALILLVLLYNIGWHVAQGQLVGWKQLNEPKTVFTLLPFILILWSSRLGNRQNRMLIVVGAFLAALVIFLSGERKAYLFAVAALVIWQGTAIWRYALVGLLVVPVLWFAMAADQSGYLGRQIASLSDSVSGDGRPDESISILLDERRPMTMSNAQREFSRRLANSLWREKPLLGIGTNAFEPIMQQQVSVPRVFRVGVHGEFHRALYENGIVGFCLYIALWLAALTHIALTWRITRSFGDPDLNKLKLIVVTMFLTYCTFEASKGLTLQCICALPFIVGLLPRPDRQRVRAPTATSFGDASAYSL